MRKYRVVDDPFNRENCPDLIGKVFDKAPSYAKVEIIEATERTALELFKALPEEYQHPQVREEMKTSLEASKACKIGTSLEHVKLFGEWMCNVGQQARKTITMADIATKPIAVFRETMEKYESFLDLATELELRLLDEVKENLMKCGCESKD